MTTFFVQPQSGLHDCFYHRENGGTLGLVLLIINPIYTLVGISLIFPFQGLLVGGETARVPSSHYHHVPNDSIDY